MTQKDASRMISEVWEKLASHCSAMIDCGGWIDSAETAEEARKIAEIAEFCLNRVADYGEK